VEEVLDEFFAALDALGLTLIDSDQVDTDPGEQ
jgi:hypothetical protein